MIKTPFRLLPLLLLAGCASLPGPTEPVVHYVLNNPGPVVPAPHTLPGMLLLREMDAPAFYQDEHLAYSKQPGTRAHYEFASWTEPLARRLSWLLRQRIEAAQVFEAVAPMSGGIIGDYQLNTRLIDFYHDATTPPGSVLLLIEAELVRRDRAALLGREIFIAQYPAAAYDAAGAAEAMDRAANEVIDAIVAWLGQMQE